MAKLNEAMKALIADQLSYVATSMPDGKPTVAVKGSLKIIDDEHVAFFEMMGGRTWQNIQKNPWVAIAVADSSKFKAFRFEGKAEIVTSGPLYDEAIKLGELMKLPTPPKAAIKVKIEEIYDIGKGGMKVA